MEKLTGSAIITTEMGWVGISVSGRGLRRVTFPHPNRGRAREELGEDVLVPESEFGDLPERLRAYFSGEPVSFPDQLDFSGASPFQRCVWESARLISYGRTVSYGALAWEMGHPGVARAVGRALGQNPLPIVVPCHRVTRVGGRVGGYRGGMGLKETLLRLEARGTASNSRRPARFVATER